MDVVVGVAVGAVFLAGTVRLTDQHPTRTLALSTVLGVLAFATTNTATSGLALSVAAVGLLVWVGTVRFSDFESDATEG